MAYYGRSGSYTYVFVGLFSVIYLAFLGYSPWLHDVPVSFVELGETNLLCCLFRSPTRYALEGLVRFVTL